MKGDLRKLTKSERFCLDSLKNLAHMVDNFQVERDRDMLEGWQERLQEIFEEYKETRLELEVSEEFQGSLKARLESDALEQSKEGKKVQPQSVEQANRDARAEFEHTYVRLKGLIKSKIRAHGLEVRQPAPAPAPVNVQQSRVKLPEIKLPIFDGTIREWSSFRDSFRSLIDSNPQLSNVDKFSYLLSSLSKDAKRVVEVI